MFVHSYRPIIALVWLLIFGLLALLWSLPTVAMGIVLLLVGLAGPVLMLIEWSDGTLPVARAMPRVEGEGSERA